MLMHGTLPLAFEDSAGIIRLVKQQGQVTELDTRN
jgi:hypothetical protein